jgi:hypothetical protein
LEFFSETKKFLSRSDWSIAANGFARMKLRQNGTVALSIKLDAPSASGWAEPGTDHFRSQTESGPTAEEKR